jgi:hypothetical protein
LVEFPLILPAPIFILDALAYSSPTIIDQPAGEL